MINDSVNLQFITTKRSGFFKIYLIAELSVFFIGIILYKCLHLSEEVMVITTAIMFFSTLYYIQFDRKRRNYSFKRSGVILRKDGLTKYTEQNYEEVLLHEIKKILIVYYGYDEGSVIITWFGSSPHRGDRNMIKILYKNGDCEKSEFYIETERDSIVLKNILIELKRKVDVEVVRRIVNAG